MKGREYQGRLGRRRRARAAMLGRRLAPPHKACHEANNFCRSLQAYNSTNVFENCREGRTPLHSQVDYLGSPSLVYSQGRNRVYHEPLLRGPPTRKGTRGLAPRDLS